MTTREALLHALALGRSRAGRAFVGERLQRHLRVRRSWRRSRTEGGRALPPVELEVELTTRCNLRCRFCAREVTAFGDTDLPMPMLDDALRATGAAELRFSGQGEPTVSPVFLDAVGCAARHGARASFVTNGLRLAAALGAGLDPARLRLVTVSIDAACTETYRRVRGSTAFDTLLAGLTALSAHRRAHPGSPWPHITFNWILMHSNLGDFPALLDLIHRNGLVVDAVHGYPLVAHRPELAAEVVAPTDPALREILGEARRRARAAGIDLRVPYYERHDGGRDRRLEAPACTVLWETLHLRHQGEIHACCEYYGRPLGDVDQPLDTVWNGRALREARTRALRAELPFPFCRNCHKLRGGDARPKLARARGE